MTEPIDENPMADGPHWQLEQDLRTVTVTFPTKPPVALRLDVRQVEEMLSNLGEFRAHMLPQVAPDWAPGQRVGAIPDPRWYTEPDILMGDSLLHLRDPRFGWLHYLLPRDQAHTLGNYLTTQAKTPPPGPAQAKPS